MIVPQPDIQQRVLENISTTVMLFNAALKLDYINPAGEMLFAASARHLVGMHVSELLNTENSLEQDLQETLLSGHPFTQHELNVVLPQGDEITTDLIVIPLREADQPPALLQAATGVRSVPAAVAAVRPGHRQRLASSRSSRRVHF